MANPRVKFLRSIVLALLAASVLAPTAEAAGKLLALAEMPLRVGVYSPKLSPDGRKLAVITSRANFSVNRYEQTLVLIDVASGAQQTIAAAGASVDAPQWSPRGDKLAWLESDQNGMPQLHVLKMNPIAERAVMVTRATRGVRNNTPDFPAYAWSPDGESLAYITSDAPPQREGEERFNLSFEAGDNDYLAREPTLSFHLWVVPAGGGEAKQLNSGRESTTGLAWLPDGRSLLFVSQPTPHNSDIDYAEFTHANSTSTRLQIVDVAGGAVRPVVPETARVLPTPAISPNGAQVAYRHFRGPEPWVHPPNIAIVPTAGGTPRDITTQLDRDIQEFAWMADSRRLVLKGAERTGSALWVQGLQGPAHRLDVGGVIDIQGLSLSTTGALAFVGTEANHPSEVYWMKSVASRPVRLTHFNDAVGASDLGRTETLTWTLDGFDHTGALIYPPGFKPGDKAPLVLRIHGGPQSASTQSFDYFGQVMAARGWIVFKPNYRGSDPAGDRYQSAIVNDFGDGPGRDIMAGVAALQARGVVDARRMAVSGWSYGGYLSAWLIGHYQDFRAAVIGAPMTNVIGWYNLSCCSAWAMEMAGGSPWVNGNHEKYWRFSPVAYADKVKTPTLLLHRTGDPEAPLPESYYFYNALRDNGATVKLVVYPLAGHGYESDPVHERDTMRRWMGWIDEQFRNADSDPR